MKTLLIIRSSSFQQLKVNISTIKENFPDSYITLLTHTSGIETAKSMKIFEKIFDYNYNQSYCKKNKLKEFENKQFDAVIILVSNLTGTFFENVIQYGFSIKSKEYYICNIASELIKINKFQFLKRKLLHLIISFFSCILTVIIGFLYSLIYLINYIFKSHKIK